MWMTDRIEIDIATASSPQGAAVKLSYFHKIVLVIALLCVADVAHATPPDPSGSQSGAASKKSAQTADQLNKAELNKIHAKSGSKARVTTPTN
jgi:hypothetical protein